MSARRRYEILLPLQFNEGRAIPESLLAETVEELEARFHAVSWESQVVRGVWEHEGVVFAFFVLLKERLKQRFQQLDIWITSHLIDVV